MFEGQPKGLYALALANTGERFGYYTMIAVFALFLRANYGLSPGLAGTIYSSFLMLVYFFPLIGGIMADKFGYGKMVTTGIVIMFVGYVLLAIPLGGDTFALIFMLAALLLIGFGTGLFKGNLQVMVGNLYDDPLYSDKCDSGFSIFYMAINIGALFAPTAALKIKEYAENVWGFSGNDAYHFSFAVACASLIVSIAIYYLFRPTFRHTEDTRNKKTANAKEEKPVKRTVDNNSRNSRKQSRYKRVSENVGHKRGRCEAQQHKHYAVKAYVSCAYHIPKHSRKKSKKSRGFFVLINPEQNRRGYKKKASCAPELK